MEYKITGHLSLDEQTELILKGEMLSLDISFQEYATFTVMIILPSHHTHKNT